jgi:hypothetical protein
MKIVYVVQQLFAGVKALNNWIDYKGYDCDFKQVKLPDYITRQDCINIKPGENKYSYFWFLFFIDSFIKSRYNTDNFESDHWYLQDELPFTVDFNKLFKWMQDIDNLISEIKQEKPDYVFFRFTEVSAFFLWYMAYRLQGHTKIIFGNEKSIDPIHAELFGSVSDHFFVGYGENLLDAIFNNEELPKEDFRYTEDNFLSFNCNLSDAEITQGKGTFLIDLVCPFSCTFCSQSVRRPCSFKPTFGMVDQFTDYMKEVHKRNPKFTWDNVSSYGFNSYKTFDRFFENLDTNINISQIPTNVRTVLDKRQTLKQFPNVKWFLGVEHFDDIILKSMGKTHTAEDIIELLVRDDYTYNMSICVMYNYFHETLDRFNKMYMMSKIVRNKYDVGINLFNMPWKDLDQKRYDFTFVEPTKYKEYFKREGDFNFSYINNFDPHNTILKYKHNKIMKDLKGSMRPI